MGRRLISWDKIRHDYVFGVVENNRHIYPSLSYLQRKYTIARTSLIRHIKADHWKEAREQAKRQIMVKAEQKTINTLSDRLAEINLQGVEGALELLQAARFFLRGYLKAYQTVQQLPPTDDLWKSSTETVELLQRLGIALRAIQQTQHGALEAAHLALGEPTEINKEVVTYEDMVRQALAYIETSVEPSERK